MNHIQELHKEIVSHSASICENFVFPQELPIGANPLRLSKWYSSEIDIVTNQIDQIETQYGATCSCQKGCCACCSHLIAISKPEVIMLNNLLENLPKDISASISAKLQEQSTILLQNGFDFDILLRTRSESAQHNLQEKYYSLQLPCPFLDKKNSCIAYKVRPTVCWSYRYYGNPDLCSSGYSLPYSIKYDDWETLVFKRLLTVKKPKPNSITMTLLQFGLTEKI